MILITGATGFVGKQVLKNLVTRGTHIRIVVRHDSDIQLNHTDNVEVIRTHNLFEEDQCWWEQHLVGVDTVLHLAWYAEPGHYLNSAINFECLSGTLTLASACINAGIRKFIGIGTCFEYDVSKGYLSTATPLLPETIYAAAKASTYFSLSNLFALSNVNFAWCRLFYLFGEGEDSRRLVPYLINQLSRGEAAELSSGNQIRDYSDVAVVAIKLLDVVKSDLIGPINICSGIPVTVREFATKIADQYNGRHLLKFGARQDNYMDPPCVVGILA
jgi:nucleoside-diphosphate-sugar epimerase